MKIQPIENHNITGRDQVSYSSKNEGETAMEVMIHSMVTRATQTPTYAREKTEMDAMTRAFVNGRTPALKAQTRKIFNKAGQLMVDNYSQEANDGTRID